MSVLITALGVLIGLIVGLAFLGIATMALGAALLLMIELRRWYPRLRAKSKGGMR